MRFLIDADLPRTAAEIARTFGHEATDIRDIGLGAAKDSVIAEYAQSNKMCIITGDYGFANLKAYLPSKYFGLVVLRIPPSATAIYINQLLTAFLTQADIVESVVGQLAIVEPGSVRIRRS